MKRFFAILSFVIFAATAVNAQSTKDIRINEVLVKNVDNYMDDYGHRSSWIELHNTSHSTIDIGGCYLVATHEGNETRYQIPTGDPRSKIGPMGYQVFYCEGTGTKGTLYTNFTLENVESVAMLNASGKGEPIDVVEIDYNLQQPDVSIGWMTREDGNEVFGALPQTTPNATNDTEPIVPRSERFRLMDPNGGVMALSAISIVLSVLTILFLLFKVIGLYNVKLAEKKIAASKPATAAVAETKGKFESSYSGEEIAAIAMALQKYTDELHDKESAVLTINKVARTYSPWSSKIYGLHQFDKNNK